MTQEEVREIIREELSNLLRIDKFEFNKDIKIINGKNIQVGVGTGTKIGTSASQKIGFFGADPVVQQVAINEPSGSGTAGVDQASRDAIVDIITKLENLGLVAPN